MANTYCPYLCPGQTALINSALLSTESGYCIRSPLSMVVWAAMVNWSWTSELPISGNVQAETGCPLITKVTEEISALSRKFRTSNIPKHGWTTGPPDGIQKCVHLFLREISEVQPRLAESEFLRVQLRKLSFVNGPELIMIQQVLKTMAWELDQMTLEVTSQFEIRISWLTAAQPCGSVTSWAMYHGA